MNQEKQDDTEQKSQAALINNVEIVHNILRILCMVEKALLVWLEETTIIEVNIGRYFLKLMKP